ncbi:MAG: hypothetical protein ACRBBJ_03310 [Rhodomicrobiaceae bacterium]
MRLTNEKSQPIPEDQSQTIDQEHHSNNSRNLPLSERLKQVSQKASPEQIHENEGKREQNKKAELVKNEQLVPVSKAKNQKIIIKKTVKKYGLSHAIFRPITVAVLLLVGTFLTLSMGMNFYHGYKRDLEYSKSRHIDRTNFEIFQTSSIAKDKVELVIRNFNGELEKRTASHSQLAAYIKQHASELDKAQKAQDEIISLKLTSLFDKAFTDKEEAIAKYADWFFEWKRPYIILKEAISSTTSRLVKLGEYESLRTAVERDMSDYFMSHYKEQVLKPETRDAVIIEGIEQIARDAHKSYLATMAIQDAKMKAFIKQNTTFLETIPKNAQFTQTNLDWDAQRWKNPTFLMEDRAFDGIVGLGSAAVGGTIGALTIGPAVNRGLSGIFMPLSRRFATSMGARITLAEGGAVAGTMVEPVGGTIVGAAIGVVLGFAADYVVNKINEKFSRDDFISANEKAVQSTIDLWKQKLEANLLSNTGQWYDEAKAGLILVREPLKTPVKSNEKAKEVQVLF